MFESSSIRRWQFELWYENFVEFFVHHQPQRRLRMKALFIHRIVPQIRCHPLAKQDHHLLPIIYTQVNRSARKREREEGGERERKKYHNSFIHWCIFFSRVFDLIEIIHQGEFVFFMFAGFILFFWFFWRFHVHYLFVLQNDIQLAVIVVYVQ